ELFSIGQIAFFGFEFQIFFWLEGGLLNFFFLKRPDVYQLQAPLLIAFELCNSIGQLAVTIIGGSELWSVNRAKTIEQAQALGSVKGEQAFVLRVDGGQFGSKLFQHGDGG